MFHQAISDSKWQHFLSLICLLLAKLCCCTRERRTLHWSEGLCSVLITYGFFTGALCPGEGGSARWANQNLPLKEGAREDHCWHPGVALPNSVLGSFPGSNFCVDESLGRCKGKGFHGVSCQHAAVDGFCFVSACHEGLLCQR